MTNDYSFGPPLNEPLLRTKEDLVQFLARHPERHRKMGPNTCSCGWHQPWPWADHDEAMYLRDLADVLPSDHEPPRSWSSEVERLWTVIERRDRAEFPPPEVSVAELMRPRYGAERGD